MTAPKKSNWRPGQSGNPAGRPPGITNAKKMRDTIGQKDLKAILTQLVAQAKSGDTAAAKLLLDRALPPLKVIEMPVRVDGVDPSASTLENASAVIAALADGHIAPGQVAAILNGLASLAKVREVEELEKRIEVLEAMRTNK